jgi:predicted amidohydrolase
MEFLKFSKTLARLVLASLCLISTARASEVSCQSLFSAGPAHNPLLMGEPMDNFRVAAVQYPLSENLTPEAFLLKVARYIDDAEAGGAQLVVFPELLTTELVNWQSNEGESIQLQRIAETFAPQYIEWLKNQSIDRGIAILGGTTPRVSHGKIVNSAVLALPDGRVLIQDKLYLTPDEKAWGWSESHKLQVFNTPWGRTAITICFDCEFPSISHMLAPERPDVLLVPSWTSTKGGLNRVGWTAHARAIEHYAYVIKTGTVPAPSSTQAHFGQAAIISPQETGWPEQSIEGSLNADSIVFGDLDLAALRVGKAKSGYYPSHEQGIRIIPVEKNKEEMK